MHKRNHTGIKPYLFITFTTAAAALLSGCAGSPGVTGGQNGQNMSAPQVSKEAEAEAAPQETPGTAPPNSADTASMEPGWQYQWQEVTVTLPAAWEDRCVILEHTDGFSIFQKASYEKDSGLGFICSLLRTTEYLNYGMGETLLAYTDNGQLYYLMQATDFNCDAGNAEIAGEYGKMCNQVDNVMTSVQIAASGELHDDIHYDPEEYMLPVSSFLILSQENLANLSGNELWIARNEIFARHGRRFTNFYLQKYFDRCTWYQGTVPPEQFDESVLTQPERDNLQLLIAAEQEYHRQHPYPKQYKLTDTAVEDLSGDGVPNQISYQVIQEDASYQAFPLRCEITIDGISYNLEDVGKLNIDSPVTDVFYITDIVESDSVLEIAILDDGPSADPVTYFFRYDDTLSYIGSVNGFPFAELNSGLNGFNGCGGIIGETRTDLIETSYPEGYWQYNFVSGQLVYQDTEWHSYPFAGAHTLYENLPVHSTPDASSAVTLIPADTEVFFLATDMKEWILVKGKNGDKGYMQVAGGKLVDLDKIAYEVISDLYFFD